MTGALRKSLEGKTTDSIRDIVSEDLFHRLTFGEDVEYSAFHQKGKPGVMPARPHVGMTDRTLDEITEESADAMVEFLKYTG